MRIFLTADLKLGIFSNGMNQNIFALQELLTDLGHEVYLIAEENPNKDKKFSYNKRIIKDYNVITIHDVVLKGIKGDAIIQTGITYGAEWIKKLKKISPSIKNIHVNYGPRLFIDIEHCVSGSEGGSAGRHKYVDEVWTSPHYGYSIDYYKILYRTDNVKFLPYIWSNKLMKKKEKERNKNNETCFYKPSGEVNIAIMEPNNIVKNSVCPAVIAEGLYNLNPELIDSVYVWGAKKLSREPYYEKFMLNLDLAQDYKIFFKKRTGFPLIFSRHCNYLLSHQHMNALNYTYLEALYFGIPLIHNSEMIKEEAGYYYPDFQLTKGVSALKRAIETHDDRLEEYKEEGKKLIWKYSPDNPETKEAYKNML